MIHDYINICYYVYFAQGRPQSARPDYTSCLPSRIAEPSTLRPHSQRALLDLSADTQRSNVVQPIRADGHSGLRTDVGDIEKGVRHLKSAENEGIVCMLYT